MPEPINDLTRLESELQRLTPASPRLDRDNLFHSAGRIQGERRLIFWKTASLTLAALAVGLVVCLIFRPVQIEQKVIAVAVPVIVPAEPTSAPESASPGDSIPLFEREPGIRPNGMSYQEMRLRGLRSSTDGLVVPAPQQISAEIPRPRPVEDDLNLPRETLPEWKSPQRVQ
ncbi:MAG TPA: hypothetical protein VGZ47_06890 [Gemmataceae bacterium]|jgi:hypothetical protein|nr:hypothetical protein [Gemmataceae bacterium]